MQIAKGASTRAASAGGPPPPIFRNSYPMHVRLRHKSETCQASTCLDVASVIDVASPSPCRIQQEQMSRRAASARLKQGGSQTSALFFRRSWAAPALDQAV